jgi:hypothetical protein
VLYLPPGVFVGHDALDKFVGDLRAHIHTSPIRLTESQRCGRLSDVTFACASMCTWMKQRH